MEARGNRLLFIFLTLFDQPCFFSSAYMKAIFRGNVVSRVGGMMRSLAFQQ